MTWDNFNIWHYLCLHVEHKQMLILAVWCFQCQIKILNFTVHMGTIPQFKSIIIFYIVNPSEV